MSLKTKQKITECWIANKKNNPDNGWQNDISKYSFLTGMDFDREMIITAQKLGYSRFKLCGRDLSEEDFKHELFYYTHLLLDHEI